MSKMSPNEMAQILAKGLLSFPVTHFDKDFRFQEGPYREHCAWLLGFKRLTGLFAARTGKARLVRSGTRA